MKRVLFTTLFALLAIGATTITLTAQEGDRVIGRYLTEDGRAIMAIEKEGELYIGRMVESVNDEDYIDTKNPDPSKRGESVLGSVIIREMRYNGKEGWIGGSVYDPETGKTYKARMTLDKEGNLRLRGFVGVSLLGRTTVWKKQEK